MASNQQQSGQGNSQMGDKDILQLILNESKHQAESLNSYILETNDEKLRQDYMRVLGEIYAQHKQVYELMQQKGFYQPQPASAQQMAQAQQQLQGNFS